VAAREILPALTRSISKSRAVIFFWNPFFEFIVKFFLSAKVTKEDVKTFVYFVSFVFKKFLSLREKQAFNFQVPNHAH